MTKRMLSLLLALVMTLSLCVPALAADEFAAEAVTEVEEQAPEAPEAPVAPEAEEPADEPVAEEPVADAPEAASVLPEETVDEPLLVALGVVTKEAHWELYKAIEKADEIMPKVEGGELRESDYNGVTAIDLDADDPFDGAVTNFMSAYNEAKKYMDGINGVEVDVEVTTNSVNDVCEKLNDYVLDDGATKLVDTGDGTSMTSDTMLTLIKNNADKSYGDGATDPKPSDLASSLAKDSDVTKDSGWKKAYKADYLTALQAAIDAVESYPSSPKYADYTAVMNKIIAALKMEKNAAKPDSSDQTALKKAITAAKTASEDYVKTDYVQGKELDDITGFIDTAEGLLSDTEGLNGWATSADLYKVNHVIEQITQALVKKTPTLKYVKNAINTDGKKLDITVSTVCVDGKTTDDGVVYGYAYKIGDKWFAGEEDATKELDEQHTISSSSANHTNNNIITESSWSNTTWTVDSDDSTKNVLTFSIEKFTDKDNGFKSGDTVTINFYAEKKVNDKDKWERIGTQTITVKNADYAGPTIDKVEITYGDSAGVLSGTAPTTVAGLLTAAATHNVEYTKGANVSATVTLSDNWGELTNNSVKLTVGKKTAGSQAASKSSKTVTLDSLNETYIVAGDAVVSLNVSMNGEGTEKDQIERDSEHVTIKALSQWNKAGDIKKYLEQAKKLKSDDYKLKDGVRGDVDTIEKAFKVIGDDVALIEGYLSSTTMANTETNRKQVVKDLNSLLTVIGYLQKKGANTDALDELIDQAKAIYDEGDEPYTFDSWGKFVDAKKAAEKANGSELQSEIDKLAADLKAAMDGLTKEGAVDKTALNASIAAAEALKEEDYTEESWAANKAAIDAAVAAAKTVAANANATQSMVDAAKATLDAAVAKLEKVGGDEPSGDENHPAPAGGTGWSYDKTTGEYYFYKNNKLVANYWVGKVDGASQWAGNWYYVGADGKLLTGMQYVDDLHGGKAWYFLQPTNDKGEIGKMLTDWQWVGGEYGECYFSKKSGSEGKCTWSELLGDWNGTAFVK